MANTQTMQSLILKKTLLYIGVSSLVIVMIWIALSTALSIKKTTIPSNLQEKTKPITPTIDVQTINQLKNRRTFTEAELSSFPISKEQKDADGKTIQIKANESLPSTPPTPTPSSTTTLEATSSGETIL